MVPYNPDMLIAPPLTGMPSSVMGKIVALNIVDRIKTGRTDFKHKASMGKMGAACIVSAGFGMLKGNAATITTKSTIFWRRNLIWQAWRFIVLNLKMMRIIVGGHS